MLVAAHPSDLRAAAEQGLRTAFVARPAEYGPRPPAERAEPGASISRCTIWASWRTASARERPRLRRAAHRSSARERRTPAHASLRTRRARRARRRPSERARARRRLVRRACATPRCGSPRACATAGLQAGDRLAIYAENRPGFVYAYLGALRAGAIVVTVNVLYRTADLEHVLDDATPSVVCVSAAERAVRRRARRPHRGRPGRRRSVGARRIDRAAGRPARTRPGGRRDHHLHQRHHRAQQGRDAQPRQPGRDRRAARRSVALDRRRHAAADAAAVPRPRPGRRANGTLVAGGRVLLRERFDAPARRRGARGRRGDDVLRRADDVRAHPRAGRRPTCASTACGCSSRARPRCRRPCTRSSRAASACRSSSATARPSSASR